MSTENCLNTRFVQNDWKNTEEWEVVSNIASQLIQYLNDKEIYELITTANKPGKKSSEIQNIVLKKTIELGFIDESQGLFADYKNNRLRPDYFKKLKNNTGILLEVERGKTNQNNMDFLDFWKCHICKHAHYLFLLVPKELRQNESGKIVGRPYQTVVSHMETFFMPDTFQILLIIALIVSLVYLVCDYVLDVAPNNIRNTNQVTPIT